MLGMVFRGMKLRIYSYKAVFVFLFFLLLMLFLRNPIPSVNASGSQYKRSVTIDNSNNTNTLSNYQVSISLDSSSLISAGKMNADCSDIRFNDSDDTTAINNYWVENCNNSATKIWVKVPSIPASSSKTIYLYYGNSAATALSSTTNTFIADISNLIGAWPLEETSGSTATDYSGNGNNGTATGTTIVSGKFTKARAFNGSSYVTVPIASQSVIPNGTAAHTICAWGTVSTANPIGFGLMFGYGTAGSTDASNAIGWDSGALDFDGYADALTSSGFWSTANQWHFACGVYNGSTAYLYGDGSLLNSGSKSYNITSSSNLFIGAGPTNDTTNNWAGDLEQITFYNAALTSSQISNLYSGYGYVTTNDSGHVLVRQFSSPEPSTSVGSEVSTATPTPTPIPQTSSSGNSSSTNPNVLSGWSDSIMAGPHYVGTVSFIQGESTAHDAETFIGSNAIHDDINVSIQKRTLGELESNSPPIPFPWSQGLNIASDLYDFTVVTAFNGYPLASFDNPVTIILPFNPSLLPDGKIPELIEYNTKERKWENMSHVVVNWQNNTVATTTKKFSYFAVAYVSSSFSSSPIRPVLAAEIKQTESTVKKVETVTQHNKSAPKNIREKAKKKMCFLFICWK